MIHGNLFNKPFSAETNKTKTNSEISTNNVVLKY